jgi:hypothetical protein
MVDKLETFNPADSFLIRDACFSLLEISHKPEHHRRYSVTRRILAVLIKHQVEVQPHPYATGSIHILKAILDCGWQRRQILKT